MGFTDTFRFRKNQTTPTKPKTFRFAPGWLAENQRSAIRALAGVLTLSLVGNMYQFKLREDIATAPPEAFAVLLDSDFSTAKVVNVRDLTVDELEATAVAEVRRFVYRLRRIDNREQVQENIGLMYCSATAAAAVKANNSFDQGETAGLLKKGSKRVLLEKGVHAGRRPGEKVSPDGMWVTATWKELIEDGTREKLVEHTAEFRVQRFKDISSAIRLCNPLGTLVTDYNFLSAE